MSRIHSICVLLGSQIRGDVRDRQEQDRQHHEQQQGGQDQKPQSQPFPATGSVARTVFADGHRCSLSWPCTVSVLDPDKELLASTIAAHLSRAGEPGRARVSGGGVRAWPRRTSAAPRRGPRRPRASTRSPSRAAGTGSSTCSRRARCRPGGCVAGRRSCTGWSASDQRSQALLASRFPAAPAGDLFLRAGAGRGGGVAAAGRLRRRGRHGRGGPGGARAAAARAGLSRVPGAGGGVRAEQRDGVGPAGERRRVRRHLRARGRRAVLAVRAERATRSVTSPTSPRLRRSCWSRPPRWSRPASPRGRAPTRRCAPPGSSAALETAFWNTLAEGL